MANYVTVTLDTTPPGSPSVSFQQGSYTATQLVDLILSAAGGDVAQMKIWGDVDTAYDAAVQDTEAASQWITYNTAYQVKLSAVDGVKTVYVRFRDDVYNESAQASASIQLDTTLPVVTITAGPSPAKVSKVPGKDTFSITWQVDTAFDEYVVMVVANAGDPKASGAAIGSANGSTNVAGAAGGYAANTSITTTINGADLEAASLGDGAKIVKVFVREHAEDDVWSA